MTDIMIKYFNDELPEIKKVEKGDWIDLRCAGAKHLFINNTIEYPHSTDLDLPLLKRHSVTIDVDINFGYFKEDLSKVKYFTYKAGDALLIDLGIAMKLPGGCEAHILPRSSTFKNFTILQTNSMAVIDESYCGDNDRWFLPVLAMAPGFMIIGERICQFRVADKMQEVNINKVLVLGNPDRSGHGSSGTK